MRTTLKNKTELRKYIKNSIGNTNSLNYVEFYNDWTWEIMDCGTWSENRVSRMEISAFVPDTYINIDTNITSMFSDIETKITNNQYAKE